MKFDTVYYSHFWYSRFANISIDTFDGNFFENEITNHCHYLRLLALFFKTIYIPRTHLLTQLFPDQWKIPEHLFRTRDFRYLSEIGTIRISTFPGLDKRQDAERIISRSSLTDEVIYAMEKNFLDAIPESEKIVVPSNEEAKSNAATFPQYGRWLEQVSRELGQKFAEVANSSTLKDIPFFHERFVLQLKREFDAPTFARLWRDTNSIYLTSGGIGLASFISYFNERIESLRFRHTPYKVDRYLYNPSSLYTFLNLLLTNREVNAFLNGPIEKSLESLLSKSKAAALLEGFRGTYFQLVDEISPITAREPYSSDLQLPLIGTLQQSALDQSLQEKAKLLEGMIGDAKTVAGVFGSETSSIILSLAGPAVKYGTNLVEDIRRRRRFPEMVAFVAEMKKRLAEK
jgi:hypothetical protein